MNGRELVIGVVGLGYVGLAYAIAFSLYGFRVIGVDIDEERVKAVRSGLVNGFSREAVLKAVQNNLLKVSTSYDVLEDADVVFIAVSTPTKPDGSQDLSQVLSALKSLADVWRSVQFDYRVIVLKSTILPGTTRMLAKYARDELGLPLPNHVGFVHNPEFLRADKALEDVLRPSRVVIGGIDEKSSSFVAEFYKQFYGRVGVKPPIFIVSPEEAELIKYASNTFLALKTVYGNIIGLICRSIENCDAWKVMEIVGLDPRIGKSHLMPGMPYGGPCLVKDVYAFAKFVLEKIGLDFVKHIHDYNEMVLDEIIKAVKRSVKELRGKKVAVLGVAYKPKAMSVKDSQSLRLCEKLLREGAQVYIHDINGRAIEEAKRLLKEVQSIDLNELRDMDVVIITSSCDEYKHIPAILNTSTIIIDVAGVVREKRQHNVISLYTSGH